MVHLAHHSPSDAAQAHVPALPTHPQQARLHGKLKRFGSLLYPKLLRFVTLLDDQHQNSGLEYE